MDNNKKIQIIKKAITEPQAKKIGDRIGVNWKNIKRKEFTDGINVEREHWSAISPRTNITKNNSIETWKIALAHLTEMSDYYTKLKKMEKGSQNK